MNSNVHYNLDKIDPELRKLAEVRRLTGPCFIGQGLSKSVGSDCYGYYITEIKKSKTGKPIVGMCCALSKFEKCWEDGHMICSLPPNPKTVEWITISGKTRSGKPKWWYCSEDGKKFNGQHAYLSWNGAYSYQDPSF